MRKKLKYSQNRVGIDILSLQRFQKTIQRFGIERISARICSTMELERLSQIKNPTSYLANIWSCKEALYKALSFTECKRNWKQVSLLKADSGAPYLRFKSRFNASVSISHDSGLVVSAVFLQRNQYRNL